VRVTSPVFPSYNLIESSTTSSSEFEVPIQLSDPSGYIESDGNLEAILVCNDNDTERMFVRDR
jgi:hypothetical protein